MERRTAWRWRLRRWGLLTVDLLLLSGGLALASAARYDGDLGRIDPDGLFSAMGLAATAYVVVSLAL
ncbi:MAG: hypothetical protein QOJ19_4542, partial [Acidimicrobiia bacterium]|nr:hypothetical protein [Acidimicrobiia bacterium]